MLALEQLRLTAPQAASTTLRLALTSCIEDGGGEGQAAWTASGNPGVLSGVRPSMYRRPLVLRACGPHRQQNDDQIAH